MRIGLSTATTTGAKLVRTRASESGSSTTAQYRQLSPSSPITVSFQEAKHPQRVSSHTFAAELEEKEGSILGKRNSFTVNSAVRPLDRKRSTPYLERLLTTHLDNTISMGCLRNLG